MRLNLIALVLLTSTQSALFAQPVIQGFADRPRIVVDGLGEVKTPPDVAVISYTVRGEGSTSDDAVRAMTTTAARIEAALHGIDPAAEPRTSQVKITAVKSADCKEQEDNSPQLSVAACAVVGFLATQPITLQTALVKRSGTMVGLIGRSGGFDAEISDFDLRDPRAAQQQATAAALADAASKATVIASAGRITLGPLISVTTVNQQEQAMIVTGLRRNSDKAAAGVPPVEVNLEPQPIVTRANLTVTYAIQR